MDRHRPACRRSLAALALTGAPSAAFAHSFGQVYNLPVPVWLYLYGAAAALVLSFVVVGYFATESDDRHPAHAIELGESAVVRLLRRIRLIGLLRIVAVLMLVLCVVSGLFGARNAYGNFNMTFFWVVFILGFGYFTAICGDSYAVLSPWRTLADLIGRFWGSYARGRLRYPSWLGYWPALLLYMGFVWIELFGNTRPYSLSVILAVYTTLNLIGVWLLGKTAWFGYCEFLAVYFRLLAKAAPIEYRPEEPGPGRLRLRWPFSGLLEERADSISLLLFVLFMLSSTAFDGLHETVIWMSWFWLDIYKALTPWISPNPFVAYPTLRKLYLSYQTTALVLSPFLYLLAYLLFVWLAKHAARSTLPLRVLALRFTYSLIPIALVYNITHYYTLLLVQGPRILSLASDPLGRRWDLFGTASWFRAPFIPDMGTVWHVQVGLIVLGHIVSVYLAHVEALRLFPKRSQAIASQLPMLLLMILFTTAGLWILSQPIKPGA